MSTVFSNTTTKNGLIQKLERKLGFNDGDISGDAGRLAYFTGDLNSALDYIYGVIFKVGGTWQFDDSNHTDYPIITTNLVSGQRDYSFTSDANGNLILDIQKVFVADETGLFREVTPVDVPSGAPSNYTDGQNTQGQPNSYEKNGNGIFLDPIPNYNRTGGLKIYVNREGYYFTVADTTRKPGFAGLFHDYLVYKVAYEYSFGKVLPTVNVNGLKEEMLRLENAITEHYMAREKDVQKKLVPATNRNK